MKGPVKKSRKPNKCGHSLSIGRGISSQAKNGILRKLQQRQHNQLQFITGVVLKKRDSSDYKIGM